MPPVGVFVGTGFLREGIRYDELTVNGIVEPARLYESPYTDHAPTGPEAIYPDDEVDVTVDILHEVKSRPTAGEVA